MKNVVLAGKPVWIEARDLDRLETGLRLKFEEVEGKEVPDFQDLWITTRSMGIPNFVIKLYTPPKYLREVAQWLSRVGEIARIEREDTVMLCYQHGRVGPPFYLPYPQDIDTYVRDNPDWF